MSIIDSILEMDDFDDAIMEMDDYLAGRFEDEPDSLSEPEKNVLFVLDFEKEINNGGFSQFFWNSTGNFAQETLLALNAIKAEKTYILLAKAISVFPNSNVEKNRAARRDIIDEIGDQAEPLWNSLNKSFYKYEDDITVLILQYIKANKKNFA